MSLTCEKGTYLQMDGRAVFQFALSRVPEVIREVLKEAEVPVEEIDAFILHQANSRIIDGEEKESSLFNLIKKIPPRTLINWFPLIKIT